MENSFKKRILIIGGGYSGVSLIDKLKKFDELEIILIDKSDSHLLQTHIHKYLSGHYKKEDILFDYDKFCKKNSLKFIKDEVKNINYDENYVSTKSNLLISYDYIIIATGSLSIFPNQIKNVRKYTKDIKNIDNLDFYRDKFHKLMNTNPKNKNILVVGGGVSGVQIACELAYTLRENNLNKYNIQVTIVEGMNTILPGMDEILIKKAENRCRDLGINIITNLFASEVLEDKLTLSNNISLDYDLLIFVVGVIGNNIEENNVDLNQRNQIVIDEYYNVSGFKNAYCIGDIAQAIDVNTKFYQTPTAQGARMQAELIAKNILNSIKGKKLYKNNISNKGIFIDLGGPSYAIGKIFSINLWNKLALIFKKTIYALHSLKLK